jgi:type VI secretion system secreted protein VgrG
VVATDALIELSGDTLPGDAHVVRYEAREYISRPFEVDVEFFTEDTGFDVAKCLRKSVLLTLVDMNGETRHFHGLVERAEYADFDGTRLYFVIALRPALAALAHREGCRIFQEKSIIHVIKEVLEGAGVGEKVEWALFHDYESRDYIVQYRESELNFVHRLFEDDGLFYFFRHTPDGHKMIVSDDVEVFAKNADAPEVHFAMSQGLLAMGDPILEFTRTRALRNTNVLLRDYDFEKPQVQPKAEKKAEDKYPLDFYEFPGGFTKGKAGDRRALARLRELRRDADTCHGRSHSIGMRVGVPFDVEGASHSFLNGEFVTTELRSWGEQRHEQKEKNFVCNNEFSGIPKGSPFAAPRTAMRPRIHGIQTAVVMGPSAEEEGIHTDKYGRVKVHFFWDRVGQLNDKATCWLRTEQLITGGSMILPRLSWEVAVAFFNGDPDQPYCLGRIYNGEKTVPYALPGANATGTIKSHSTPGGAGHNEMKLSDTGGSQGFAIHAQKDHNTTIGHDKNETIAVDETHTVKVNMQSTVGSNETITVGANQNIDVGANLSQKVKGSQTVTVGAVETFNTTHNYVENCGGSRTYTVGANMTTIANALATEAKSGITRTIGAAQLVGSVAAIADNIGGSYTENIGAVKLIVCKGVVSEAVGGMKTLTCAAAELHLVSGNFQTQAKTVTHLIGGLHYEKVGGDYSIKAPMITLLGATGTFKGGDSELKLGGGPIVIKGSKIAVKGALMIKMGAALKMGA